MSNKQSGSSGSVNLMPGMFASVSLKTDILKDRLIVPNAAVLWREQRSLAFVAENGLAKWCYVQTGAENEDEVEIKSGINAGDTVITKGHYALAHDARVKIVN
jgi:multidrug efflux pump subunit AcrA (membrane-fusion protein)